jgi:hypothetical protein
MKVTLVNASASSATATVNPSPNSDMFFFSFSIIVIPDLPMHHFSVSQEQSWRMLPFSCAHTEKRYSDTDRVLKLFFW